MAQWALQFTPCVSIDDANEALLLEVQSSLRLWGGKEKLCQRLTLGWHAFGWSAPDTIQMACGPTPRAALWVALCMPPSTPSHPDATLHLLPVDVIKEAQPHIELLQRMGIRTIGQLNALPRGGLNRRFGKSLLQALDSAYGRAPDLRVWIRSPEFFRQERELPARADNTTLIEQAASYIFQECEAWLMARQLGVNIIELTLHHDNPPPTIVRLGFASPARQHQRFARLLSERLTRIQSRHAIPRPVYRITLDASSVASLPHRTADFLGGGRDTEQALHELIERLEARLGESQVHGLDIHDEHRPEKASTASRELFPANPLAVGPSRDAHRPSWLLATPLLLALQDHRPSYHGPLQLLSGPERIEAGWWDDTPNGATQRDYFVAKTRHEALLWVFRTPAYDWYLHGFFS